MHYTVFMATQNLQRRRSDYSNPVEPVGRSLKRSIHTRVLLLISLILTLGSGCNHAPKQTNIMKASDVKVGASTGELRHRTIAYAKRAAGFIEETADEIRATGGSPDVRKAALRWKLSAIPLIQEAALQPDPLVAIADIWSFVLQMREFFISGAGRQMFGEHQALAIAACERLAADGESVVGVVLRGADTSIPRGKIEAWAAANPIHSNNFRRDFIAAAYSEQLFGKSAGTLATVSNMEQTIRDIDYRLGFFNEYLLKQARWTVELSMIDAVDRLEVDAAIGLLRESVSRMTALAAELPHMLEQQRDGLWAALALEREATLGSIDAQRADTLSVLSQERIAILEAMDAQRQAIFTALESERDSTLAELESLVERSLMSVVDHAFWRLAQLLGVAAVAGFVLLLVFRRTKAGTV
jgi:hypothetical protein